jgi:hypothetical protein
MYRYFSDVLDHIQKSSLEDKAKQEVVKNSYHASDAELEILFSVMNIRAYWVLQRRGGDKIAEILKGAHVRIQDSGRRYDDWKRLSDDPRPSSHPSDVQAYQVKGPLVHAALFGQIGDRTWLQLEGNPLDVRHFFGHAYDFFAYTFTHENQGPYGSSRYIDTRPLEVQPRTYWREIGDFPTGLDRSVG